MFGRVVFNYTTFLKFWGRVDRFILKKKEILRKSYIVSSYAVDGLNVISSDERSEKSLKTGPTNGDFRDFSSLCSSK